ncbi:MAG: thiosulfate oxidation carrier protein SoxY [Pseudomonadota bacterium]
MSESNAASPGASPTRRAILMTALALMAPLPARERASEPAPPGTLRLVIAERATSERPTPFWIDLRALRAAGAIDRIEVFSTEEHVPSLARFELAGHAPRRLSGRVTLTSTTTLLAIAELSDGRILFDQRSVTVSG